jgi:hypothetical protein
MSDQATSPLLLSAQSGRTLELLLHAFEFRQIVSKGALECRAAMLSTKQTLLNELACSGNQKCPACSRLLDVRLPGCLLHIDHLGEWSFLFFGTSNLYINVMKLFDLRVEALGHT